MSYHHKSMEGYISPRCVTAMPGCDDLACVCVCHPPLPAEPVREGEALGVTEGDNRAH